MSEREKRMVEACGEYASIAKLSKAVGISADRMYRITKAGLVAKIGSKVSTRGLAQYLDRADELAAGCTTESNVPDRSMGRSWRIP